VTNVVDEKVMKQKQGRWTPVAGGLLPAERWRPAVAVADLWWWPTPLTRGQARSAGLDFLIKLIKAGGDDLPATGLTRSQAAELAHVLGGRLPTSHEWEWMASGGHRMYPWGNAEPTGRHANLRDRGPGRTSPVGSYPVGASPDGLVDVAGNVWEWTSTSGPGRSAVVRGGSYQSLTLYARCGFINEIPDSIQSPGIGLRMVRAS
jgi:formylglycine-generating enzyme required for sulfatase activity